MKYILYFLVVLLFSNPSLASVGTITQPPFVVDTEGEKDGSWPDNSVVFSRDTGKLYQLKSGVWVQINLNPRSASLQTRSIVTGTGATGFQISSSRNSQACYSVTNSTTANIGGAASSIVVLEMAPTNSATAGDWQELARTGNSQTITLALVLQSVQPTSNQICGFVPAGYYAKLRSILSGTSSATYNSGQEILE